MHLPFPPLASVLGIEPWIIGIAIPIAGMVLGGIMGVSAMYFKNRTKQMWHETARLALEKGQPLPALPTSRVDERSDARTEGWNDLRGGVVLVGTGLGLWLFLGEFINRGLGYVGAIPGFIGVGLLLSGTIRLLTAKKESAAAASTLPRS